MSLSRVSLLAGAAIVLAAVAPAPLAAQTAGGAQPPAADPRAADADSSDDPADVVVTAQRRTERLQDVPISVAVVSGNTLAERNVQEFESLARLVPNLTIAKSPAANLILLRGIGSSPGSPSLDQSVVLFIDGIYAGNSRQFAMPFLDVERIEVLRGPQGALVGRNTSAGAINVITHRPGHELGGYADASYNLDYHGPALEAGLDLPVSGAISVRAVGKYVDQAGPLTNTVSGDRQPDRRDAVGRVSVAIDNGGPVTADIKYEHGDLRITGSPVQLFAPGTAEVIDYRKDTSLTTGREYDDQHSNNVAATFNLDLGGPTLVAISGYSAFTQRQREDADFFSGNFATADFDQIFDQFSQEVRLLSPSAGRITYSLGAYVSAAKLNEERTTGVLTTPAASSYRRFTQQTDVFSTYGQLTVRLTDQLRASGSLRYTTETKDASYLRLTGATAATLRTGTQAAFFTDRLSNNRIDPSASLQYNFDQNAMIYASFSRGSKGAGFQGAISNATPAAFRFRPETSTSYEAGVKLSFPGLGYFNLAGFYTRYTDLQVSAAIATPGALSASFFTGNAPKSEVIGAESEFSLRLARVFTLGGSVSWLPTARYVDFTAGPCYTQQVANGSLAGSCNQSGNRLGFTPRVSASLTVAANVPIGGGLSFKAAASPTYQSFSYRDFAGDPLLAQPAFAKLDLSAGIGGPNDRWSLSVLVQNVTNKQTTAFGGSGGLANTVFNAASRTVVVDPPRVVSVQARVKF